jgi:hypothetical protein
MLWGTFMKLLASAFAVILSTSVAFADTQDTTAATNAWDGANDPAIMSTDFERVFEKLPTAGSLSEAGRAWPGYYWANKKGGIAQRWHAADPQHFKYESPKRSEATVMSRETINELSPAEKYDLFLGRYDYPTVEAAWGQSSRFSSEWHGICHGVAPASLNHSEPKEVTLINPDGIEITFFAGDVKALLAYYYAKVSDSKVRQVGKRCFISGWVPLLNRWPGCMDVNPGAFHIIMANKLGIDKTGFIADMDRFKQVWNHAALDYTSTVIRTAGADRRSAQGTVRRVLVKSKVKYAATIDPTYTPVIGTDQAKYDTRTYTYWLELDSKGEIIGGSWTSKDRPDFLWFKEKDDFKGYFKDLSRVYTTDY